MESVQFALEAWSIMETAADAQQERLPKDLCASANAKTTSFSIEMEIAILVVLMRLFLMADAPARLDIPEIPVEFALFPAQMVNLFSKEHVQPAPLIPSITLPSMDAHAPTVSTWIHMAFVKD
jgi:hypothetical protein